MDVEQNMELRQLTAAGLPEAEAVLWARSAPRLTSDFAADCRACAAYWSLSALLLARLPQKSQRNADEQTAAEAIQACARSMRTRFMGRHAAALYDLLTDRRSRFLRVDELLASASAAVSGLVPGPQELEAESRLPLRDKDGLEIDQGIFISALLASEEAGRHLCHAMLLPRREAHDLAPQFAKQGAIDLGTAAVERHGTASIVTMKNPRYLNAEDQTTIDATEICVDLALLDQATSVAVLRGGPVDHPKYAGRRVFGSGINLTHLYEGRVPFVWYLERELGFVHKFYRGLARTDCLPDDVHGDTIEKLWIAAVETFAIGGHCQYLLTMDYVIAERDAFFTLPARKEGIIPGAANLRLPRRTGDRIAREAILFGSRFACDSTEGRMVCNEIIEPGSMDAAIERTVRDLSESGVVSAAANRRATRVAQEPLDLFRAYCSVYAKEQAYCHASPALVSNLERYWKAQSRER